MVELERRPITQSPWYWGYVFCAAALVMLLLLGRRALDRNTQELRNFQGRQEVAERTLGQRESQVATPLPRGELSEQLGLWPLYVLFSAGLVVTWSVVWWRHFWKRPPQTVP